MFISAGHLLGNGKTRLSPLYYESAVKLQKHAVLFSFPDVFFYPNQRYTMFGPLTSVPTRGLRESCWKSEALRAAARERGGAVHG